MNSFDPSHSLHPQEQRFVFPSVFSERRIEDLDVADTGQIKDSKAIVAVGQTALSGKPGAVVSKRLEKADIENVGGDLGKRLNYYEWFSSRGSATSAVLGFFKEVTVKVVTLLNIGPKGARKAKVNHGVLSQVLKASNVEGECPRTVAVDYMREFYGSRGDPESKTMSETLSFTSKLSQKLDRLQKVPGLKANDKRIVSMAKGINERIDSLGEGQKLLIPSGWWNESKFCDGLVEIRKEVGSVYTVRFISTDREAHKYSPRVVDPLTGKMAVCPHFTYEAVTVDKLKACITPLMQMQLPQLVEDKPDQPSWKETLLTKVWELVKGEKVESAEIPVNESEEDVVNPLMVMSAYFDRMEPTISQEDIDQALDVEKRLGVSAGGNTVKNILTYYKTSHPELYESVKLHLQISTFVELTRRCEGILDEPKLRHAVADASRKLRYELNKPKMVNLISEDAKAFLLEKIDHVQDKVSEAELSAVTSPKVMKEWEVASPVGVVRSDAFAQLKPVHAGKVSAAGPEGINCGSFFDGKIGAELTVINQELKTRLEICQKLYDGGNFELLQALIVDTVSKLPLANEFKGFELEKRDDPLAAQLQDQFGMLTQYLFEVNLASNPDETPFDVIVAATKLDALLSEVCLKQNYENKQRPEFINFSSQGGKSEFFRGKMPFQASETDIVGIEKYWQERPDLGVVTVNYPSAVGSVLNSKVKDGKKRLDRMFEVERMYTTLVTNRKLVDRDRKVHFTVIGESNDLPAKPLALNKQGHRGFHSIAAKKNTDNFEYGWIVKLDGKDYRVNKKMGETVFGSPTDDTRVVPSQYGHDRGKPPLDFTIQGNLSSKSVENARDNSGDFTESRMMAEVDDPIKRNLFLCSTDLQGLAISRTVNTFLAHPEYFDDPRLVGFFENKLFYERDLVWEVHRNPATLEQLSEGISRNYQLAMQSGNVFRAGALLESGIKLRSNIQNLFSVGGIQDNALKGAIPGVTEWGAVQEQLQAIRVKAVTREEKTYVALLTLAWTARAYKAGHVAKAALPVKDLIEDAFVFANGPRTIQTSEKLLREECETFRHYLSGDIANLKEADRQEVANRLLATVGGKVAAGTAITGTYPTWQVGPYQIDFERSIVLKNGSAVGVLSDQVRKEVFNNPMTWALWTKDLSSSGVVALGSADDGSRVTFFTPDSHPDLRLVMQPGNATRIQLKVVGAVGKKEEFYDLVVELGSPPPICSLLNNCTVWINPADTNRAVAMRVGENQPAFELTFGKDEKGGVVIDGVKRVKDGLSLLTLTDALSSDPEYGQLFGVESAQHTVLWGKGLKPLSVEYPRLKMSDGKTLSYQIVQESVNGKNRPRLVPEVSLLQGWKADLMGNVIKGADGIMPATFEQFQLLESTRGNPKVVMTMQELLPYDPDKKHLAVRETSATPWLNRAYFDRREEDTGAQRMVITEMDLQSKRLKTTSKESMAMVAYVFFAHKDYEKAAEYLRASQSAGALTESHKDVLRWVLKWPDATAEGAAFKLKAAMALVESERRHGSSGNLDIDPLLPELVQIYRVNEAEIPLSQRLTQDEWAVVNTELFLARDEEEFEPAEVLPVGDTVQGPSSAKETATNFYCRAAKQKNYHGESIPHHPDKFLEEHFVSIYQWIQAGKHQKDRATVIAGLKGCRPSTTLGETLRRYLIAATAEGAPAFPKEYNKQQGVFDGFAPMRLLKMGKAEEEGAKPIPALHTLQNFFEAVQGVTKEVPTTVPPQVPPTRSKPIERAIPEFAPVEDPMKIAQEYLDNHPVTAVRTFTFTEAQARVLNLTMPPALFKMELVAKKSATELSGLHKPGDDAATARLIDEAIADTEEYRKTPEAVTYKLLRDSDVKQLQKDTEKDLLRVSGSRKDKEKAILEKLNVAIQAKGIAGVQREKLTKIPDRLFGLYASGKVGDINSVMGANMIAEQASELDQLIGVYMEQSIEERVLTQLSQKLAQVPTNVSEADDTLAGDIKSLLETTRYYDASHPLARQLLVIEHGTFVLRKGQIKTHEALFSGTNRIRQLGMGGGKTLLIPTLLNKYADGTHLAEALLPEWLEEIAGDDVDQVCSSVYGMRTHRFKYDEKKTDDVAWLKNEFLTLEQTIKNKGAILTTRSHKLNFRNKYLATLKAYKDADTEPKREAIWEQLHALGSIVNLFVTRAYTIADEVDSVLDVRQKCIRSIGTELELPKKLSSIVVELYNRIDAWSKTESKVSPELREFAKALENNRQAEYYGALATEVKKTLAGELYDDWSSKWDSRDEENPVQISKDAFIKYVAGESSPELNAELQLNERNIPKFMQQIQRAQPEEYRKLCYVKRFISKTLDSTMTLSNNVRYGRGTDGINTRPYLAVSKPTEDKFGNRYEDVGLHCQDYMQEGLTQDQVYQFLDDIKKSSDTEITEAHIEGRIIPMQETAVFRRFAENKSFAGINLERALRDPEEAHRLHAAINKDRQAMLDFAQTWVLPTIKVAPQQVSSGPYDLVGMSNTITGFSGTPWNPDALSSDLDISEIRDPGTDGKTIDFMLTAFAEGRLHINTLENFDESKPVESIIGQEGFFATYDTLIDAGAYIRGPNNDEVAAKIAETADGSRKKAVAFVDVEDKLVVQEFGSDIKNALADRKDVPIENRFNFYAQGNSIGTDMPNVRTGRAAVTIGEDTAFFKSAQAFWRMRGLSAKGQQFDIFVKPTVAKLMRPQGGPVTADDVINYMLKIQAEREAKDNFAGKSEEIQKAIPMALDHAISSDIAKGIKPENILLDLVEKELFSPMDEDLDELAQVSSTEGAVANLENLLQKQKDRCKDIKQALGGKPEFLKEAETKLNNYKLIAENKLPKEVDANPSASGSNEGSVVQQSQQQQAQQQAAQQQQAQQQTQQQQTIHSAGGARWVSWKFEFLDLPRWSGSNRGLDITEPTSLANIYKWMPEQIKTTINFGSTNKQLTTSERKQVNRVLIYENQGQLQAVLMDLMDFDEVVKKVQRDDLPKTAKLAVYEVNGPSKRAFIHEAGAKVLDSRRDAFADNPQAIELVAIAKLFGGQCVFYDKAEREAILTFLKSKNPEEVKQIQELFEARMFSDQRVHYNERSPIYRFFHNLN